MQTFPLRFHQGASTGRLLAELDAVRNEHNAIGVEVFNDDDVYKLKLNQARTNFNALFTKSGWLQLLLIRVRFNLNRLDMLGLCFIIWSFRDPLYLPSSSLPWTSATPMNTLQNIYSNSDHNLASESWI